VINLLFKTYFKLNSASLSKNILKALSAGRGDMPPLSAFPKSQQVTFKYYEGVLCFLEENYVQVRPHPSGCILLLADVRARQKNISRRPGICVTKMRRGTRSEFARNAILSS